MCGFVMVRLWPGRYAAAALQNPALICGRVLFICRKWGSGLVAGALQTALCGRVIIHIW